MDTYEKKYKEALERARDFKNNIVHKELTVGESIMDYIFPELRESEDERIRKAIIAYIKDDIEELSYEAEIEELKKYLAWLEKQGKQEPINPELKEPEDEKVRKALIEIVHDTPNSECEQNYNVRKEEALAWLEKQGEVVSDNDDIEVEEKGIREAFNKIEDEKQCKQKSQRMISAEAKEAMYDKPADKVEPKFKVKYAGSEYNVLEIKEIAGDAYYGIEDEPNHIDYVLPDNCEIIDGYAIKENGSPYPTKSAVFFGAKNPTWSKEDELVVEDIEEAVINYWHGQSQEDLLDWLKSLKTKVQPKQEWSEKDEEELEIAIDTLKESGRYDSAKWVQSLKQRIGG